MTVASTTNRKSFSGDGVTTSFGTSPVVFYTASDLVVQVFSAAGVATTLTENTHYTVSGGSATGATGTVNLAGGSSPYGAPAVGETLLIRRVLPLVQEADFLNNDINDAEVSETALDKLTMLVQQVDEEIGRGLVIPPAETATDALTVLPFDRASKFLAFDASKNLIASSGTTGTVPVSTFMETVLDDTTAADARTTLGAAGSGAVTASGITMTTARLLGRTNSGTGAIQEIAVGSDLTLSSGSISVAPASDTLAGKIEVAVQSEMEAGSSTTLAVTPGRQQYHPSAAKGWCRANTSGAALISYNVTSVTDAGTGLATINWNVDFSIANHCPVATLFNGLNAGMIVVSALGADYTALACYNTSGSLSDPADGYLVAAFGDQ